MSVYQNLGSQFVFILAICNSLAVSVSAKKQNGLQKQCKLSQFQARETTGNDNKGCASATSKVWPPFNIIHDFNSSNYISYLLLGLAPVLEFYSFWLIGAPLFLRYGIPKLYKINLKYHITYCILKIFKNDITCGILKNIHTSTTPPCKPYSLFASRNLQDQKLITA